MFRSSLASISAMLALAGVVAVFCPTAASPLPSEPPPQAYALGVNTVPGWEVLRIGISHRESNRRARQDSQPFSRYFYRGSLGALGRTTGWFETLALSRGGARSEAVVLVSLFATAAEARHAYDAVLPRTSSLVPLAIGARAAEWRTGGGVASGPHGLAGFFGSFATYLQAGTVVVQIQADVGGATGVDLRPPLPNTGRAIARHLAQIATPYPHLTGIIRGTFSLPPSIPDIGPSFLLSGQGRIHPLGLCAVRGTFTGTGFSGQKARHSGTLRLYCPGGSLRISVAFDTVGSFNDDFSTARYVLRGGTGKFRSATGGGTLTSVFSRSRPNGTFAVRLST